MRKVNSQICIAKLDVTIIRINHINIINTFVFSRTFHQTYIVFFKKRGEIPE